MSFGDDVSSPCPSFFLQTRIKPPSEFLYLDGLTDLFLSKIKDAYCLPGRAFAPRVSTTVQQTWEWTKPDPELPTPAPGILWAGMFWSKRRSDLVPDRAKVEEGRVEGVSGDKSGKATAVAAAIGQGDDPRWEAVGRLLRAVGGGEETTPLWGPGEVGYKNELLPRVWRFCQPGCKARLNSFRGYGSGITGNWRLFGPSRETKFSGASADGEISFFTVQPTTSKIGNLTRLIHTLAKCVTIDSPLRPVGRKGSIWREISVLSLLFVKMMIPLLCSTRTDGSP